MLLYVQNSTSRWPHTRSRSAGPHTLPRATKLLCRNANNEDLSQKKAVAVTISGIFYNVVDMHLEDWWFVEVYFSYFDDRVLRFRSLLNLSKITGAKSSPSRKSCRYCQSLTQGFPSFFTPVYTLVYILVHSCRHHFYQHISFPSKPFKPLQVKICRRFTIWVELWISRLFHNLTLFTRSRVYQCIRSRKPLYMWHDNKLWDNHPSDLYVA